MSKLVGLSANRRTSSAVGHGSNVHETMPAAMRPGLTDLEAVLNSSACLVEKRVCNRVQHRFVGESVIPLPPT